MEQFRVASLQDTNDVRLSSNHGSAMLKYLLLILSVCFDDAMHGRCASHFVNIVLKSAHPY